MAYKTVADLSEKQRRMLLESGLPLAVLAERFGISKDAIKQFRHRNRSTPHASDR